MSGVLRDPFDETTPPEPDVPYDAGNRAHVKQRASRKKDIEKKQGAMLAALLDTKQGREWFAHILFELCFLNKPTENAAFDTNAVHFREGARAVGLTLQNEALIANRDQYMVLLSEHLTAG